MEAEKSSLEEIAALYSDFIDGIKCDYGITEVGDGIFQIQLGGTTYNGSFNDMVKLVRGEDIQTSFSE